MRKPDLKATPYFVYALCDPRNGNEWFYVGKGTWNPKDGVKARYYRHISYANNGKGGHVYNKIRKIQSEGLLVGLCVLSAWPNERGALDEEVRVIAEIGVENLTNATHGGEGCVPTEETRKKRSEALKGHPVSDETREKLRCAKIGYRHSPETLEKMRQSMLALPREAKQRIIEKVVAANKGKKATAETRAKLSVFQKGRKKSAETRRRISEARKGYVFSEEHRRKLSAAHKGVKLSKEHRQKLSEARRGHATSSGARRKIAEGMKRYWAEKKQQAE